MGVHVSPKLHLRDCTWNENYLQKEITPYISGMEKRKGEHPSGIEYETVNMLNRVQLCDPKPVACQAPLSMGLSRQEY